uniref:hypothetical protein n=1 Tax=Aerococcus urinaeequi TaxID=51665 RepID=UPI00352BBAB3
MTRSFNLGNLEIHEDGTVYRLNKNGKHEIKPVVTNIKGNDRVVITYMKDGNQKHTYLSREIAKRFVPNEHGYNIVSFKDGDTTNVAADNLKWISKAEQVAHAVQNRKAGQKICEKCGKRYDGTRQSCPKCDRIEKEKEIAEAKERKRLEEIKELYAHVDKDALSVEWKFILDSRLYGQTLQAIGDEEGVTREYIRQILKKIEKGTPQFRTKAEREQLNNTKQEEM